MTSKKVTPVMLTCQALLPVILGYHPIAMPTLPSWYPDPDERKPAPAPLLLVQAFLNTRDLEARTDLLADVAVAEEWLRTAGLVSRRVRVGPDDLDRARGVREGIRSLVGTDRHAAKGERQLGPLRRLAASGHPSLSVHRDGRVAIENAQHETLTDGLFDLLLSIRRAQEDGTWERLKACGNPECQWVYYDRSRNQQGNWCNMAVCGNRLKNRTLRERRR
jgi:predicted RNA-binding Zn ribbon-like protein